MVKLGSEENAVLLPVKVVPGASRTRLMGEWNGRAKIAVAAPPEKGKANKAIVEWLAKLLDVRKSNVSVVAGQTSAVKTIRIDGVTPGAVRTALQLDRP